jgi:collagen beta-1,O-galactosyltransferase
VAAVQSPLCCLAEMHRSPTAVLALLGKYFCQMGYCTTLLALFALISANLALFGGIPPDDGDYRHIYPITCIAMGVHQHEHTLPYVLGLVEDLKYPKDRIHFSFFLIADYSMETNASAARWMNGMKSFYMSVKLDDDNSTDWHERALKFGRRWSCENLLITDANAFIMADTLRQLMKNEEPVVSPLLNAPFGSHSNLAGLVNEDFVHRKVQQKIRVYYSNGPLFIRLKHLDSSDLTFDAGNIQGYQGNGNPIDIFAYAAFKFNIHIVVENFNFYGYYLDPVQLPLREHKKMLGYFLANLISDSGPMPFPHSAVLEPWYPPATRLGFEKIYVINLKRRPERLAKMNAILRIIGVDYDVMEAIDGNALTDSDLQSIRFMPGYIDPYYKRPMKKGEIGCFLSHYKVWKDVVQNKYGRVIVLEDDVRFTENSTSILKKVVEDLAKTQLDWDYIYLGRKKISAHGDEFFVAGHRHLSTIGYSYWTLAYALSYTGASKLINAKPLEKLLALDEFLPIMYDQHPNTEWAASFPTRNLSAFAVYPVLLVPERYTFEPGYISDTEASAVVQMNGSVATSPSTDEHNKLVIDSGIHTHLSLKNQEL